MYLGAGFQGLSVQKHTKNTVEELLFAPRVREIEDEVVGRMLGWGAVLERRGLRAGSASATGPA